MGLISLDSVLSPLLYTYSKPSSGYILIAFMTIRIHSNSILVLASVLVFVFLNISCCLSPTIVYSVLTRPIREVVVAIPCPDVFIGG